MSLINRLLKANPSAQVSSMLTGSFTIPSAKGEFLVAGRGLIAGGTTGSKTNVIDYIEISTTGNATDFGDLSANRMYVVGGGSSTRGVFAQGQETSNVNTIEYVTIASVGNATDFGDRTSTDYAGNATSNGTIMFMIAGTDYVRDYITIATTGNATAWGGTWDTTAGDENPSTGGSSTRGLIAGGYKNGAGVPKKLILYITFATTGSQATFGDLVKAGYSGKGGCSNGTRAVFKIDYSDNDLEYVTIASTGNATYFGEAEPNTSYLMAAGDTSNSVRGIFTGHNPINNVISYINIATTGNAVDFGDLTVARSYAGSTSSNHGGLQ